MTTDAVVEKSSKTSDRIKLPKKYKVVLINDDVTPVEFVIAMLMNIFKHSQPAAKEITLKVHNEGSAVAGIYTYEIAEQKTMEGVALARANNFPLQLKCEVE